MWLIIKLVLWFAIAWLGSKMAIGVYWLISILVLVDIVSTHFGHAITFF